MQPSLCQAVAVCFGTHAVPCNKRLLGRHGLDPDIGTAFPCLRMCMLQIRALLYVGALSNGILEALAHAERAITNAIVTPVLHPCCALLCLCLSTASSSRVHASYWVWQHCQRTMLA